MDYQLGSETFQETMRAPLAAESLVQMFEYNRLATPPTLLEIYKGHDRVNTAAIWATQQ